MNIISDILIISILNENVINLIIKPILKDTKVDYDIVSSITGIIFACIFGLDIFTSLGLFKATGIPTQLMFFVSNLLTGLIIGRGSNIVNKFLSLADIRKGDDKID